MGESLHERNNTLSLLDLDFCVFNSPDLLVNETNEQTGKTFVYFLQVACQKVLIRILNLMELAIDSIKDPYSLPADWLVSEDDQ